MSLLLRKATQDLLIKFNLGEYHIDINQELDMVIVGECGNYLCTVKGVTFSRKSPTKAEINFAVELLNKFLTTHKSKINKVISTKADWKLNSPNENLWSGNKIRQIDTDEQSISVYFKKGLDSRVIFYKKDLTLIKVYLPGYGSESINVADLNTFLKGKKMQNKYLHILDQKLIEDDLHKKYNAAINALNTCAI
jgi:hypothetical protein